MKTKQKEFQRAEAKTKKKVKSKYLEQNSTHVLNMVWRKKAKYASL